MAANPEQGQRLKAALARIGCLHPKPIDLGLESIKRLFSALDHPERDLPPVVHIAGTNGKGSLIAFLRSMLEAAGYRVHAYTSPHLVRFNERILVAGHLIDDNTLLSVLEEAEMCNGGEPITYFEITSAAAFLAFTQTPADVLLLETGLGGRLDATNIIERPLLTAITPITLDHQEFLGHDFAEIAAEKAGILKQGVEVVLATQEGQAGETIAAHARAVGTNIYRQDCDWTAVPTKTGFRYKGRARALDLPPPSLVGAHQIGNAGMAIACLDCMNGFTVSDAHIQAGLTATHWPGRLQHLTQGLYPAMLEKGWELWLDGGHNPGAGQVLARHAKTWCERPLHLIFGMMENKSPAGFLEPLAPYVASLHAVSVPKQGASLSPAEVANAARAVGIGMAAPANSVASALMKIRNDASIPARILICGSLYLVGDVISGNF